MSSVFEMVRKPIQIYKLLEEPEDFSKYGLQGEIAAILPAEQRVGDLGFTNYISHNDWRNASKKDKEYWKDFFKRLIFARYLREPKIPIERVYAKHGVSLEGHGFETPFLIAVEGGPEIARERLIAFLHDITDLFPQRKAEGLTFKVVKVELPIGSRGAQLDLFDVPSENIVYGIIQSPSSYAMPINPEQVH